MTTINSISAQQFEIFGGINSNHFHDGLSNDDLEYTSAYKSGKGYTVGFSFDNPNMNGYASRITLSYSKVRGSLETGFTDVNITDTSSFTDVDIETNKINLAVYPFTFIIQRIYFSFGLQANLLISNSSKGEYGNISVDGPTLRDIVDNDTFHKEFGYGLAMRAHYNIMLNNGLSIVPQYNLYYGIGEEYSTVESEKIKVWQQMLAIGIAMQF